MDGRQVQLAASPAEGALTQRLSDAASWSLWLLLAAVSCSLYALLARCSAQFEYTDACRDRPIPEALAWLGAAFVVYLLAVLFAARSPLRRGQLGFLVGAAIAYRLILLPSVPIQEIDFYRYLWDGNVVCQGINPFRYPPRVVLAARRELIRDDRLARLAELRDADPHLRTVLERIHYAELPSVYPPVSQAVFAAAAWTTPRHATVEQRVIVLKIWLAVFDLATLGLVILLLRDTRRPLGLCIVYGWCPLVLKEFSNSGHLDTIAVLLTTFAIWLVTRSLAEPAAAATTARPPRQHLVFRKGLAAVAASGALALAIGAKLYPVLLVPLFAALVVQRLGWRWFWAAADVFLATTLIVLWPLLPPLGHRGQPQPGGMNSTAAQPALTLGAAADPSRGLKMFLMRWERNDFLFKIAIENVMPAGVRQDRPQPWFSVVPDAPRAALIGPLAARFAGDRWQASFFVVRVVSLLAIGVLAAWCVRRTLRNPGAEVWLESAFLILAWFWFLSPTLNPWYWAWVMPLLVFARSRVWLWMSGVALLYYLRFWFLYQFPDTPVAGTPYVGATFFDFVVTWCEFGPWLACLFLSHVIRRTNAGRVQGADGTDTRSEGGAG